jgi:hypothetical protein
MPAPSMVDLGLPRFAATSTAKTIWDHPLNLYFRMGNKVGVENPAGYEDL